MDAGFPLDEIFGPGLVGLMPARQRSVGEASPAIGVI